MNKPNTQKIDNFISIYKALDPEKQNFIFGLTQALINGNDEEFIKMQYEKGEISADILDQIRRESQEPAKE